MTCERNKNDKKNDWAIGKEISTWPKPTFSKHAASGKHKKIRQNAFMRQQLKNPQKLLDYLREISRKDTRKNC
uniref:Uncharacterized protein n=1 Tax=Romanomermis culicivorax TaxID=13658 RepID=A0A915IPQ4_ROMCU